MLIKFSILDFFTHLLLFPWNSCYSGHFAHNFFQIILEGQKRCTHNSDSTEIPLTSSAQKGGLTVEEHVLSLCA